VPSRALEADGSNDEANVLERKAMRANKPSGVVGIMVRSDRARLVTIIASERRASAFSLPITVATSAEINPLVVNFVTTASWLGAVEPDFGLL
jgi:hypothetical protein